MSFRVGDRVKSKISWLSGSIVDIKSNNEIIIQFDGIADLATFSLSHANIYLELIQTTLDPGQTISYNTTGGTIQNMKPGPITVTLPASSGAGNSGHVLTNNGSGGLSWAPQPSASPTLKSKTVPAGEYFYRFYAGYLDILDATGTLAVPYGWSGVVNSPEPYFYLEGTCDSNLRIVPVSQFSSQTITPSNRPISITGDLSLNNAMINSYYNQNPRTDQKLATCCSQSQNIKQYINFYDKMVKYCNCCGNEIK